MNPLQKSLWNHLIKRVNLATIKGHIEQSVKNFQKFPKNAQKIQLANTKKVKKSPIFDLLSFYNGFFSPIELHKNSHFWGKMAKNRGKKRFGRPV